MGRRAAAFLIDAALLCVCGVVFIIVFYVVPAVDEYLPWSGMVGTLMLPLVYFGSEVFGRASAGKLMLGLRISDVDGRPLRGGARFIRLIVKCSPMLPPVVAIVISEFGGPLDVPPLFSIALALVIFVFDALPAFDDRGQAAHDRIVGSVVERVIAQPRGFAVILQEQTEHE
jgi:uncharacterized RDD family membrane protein YckC